MLGGLGDADKSLPMQYLGLPLKKGRLTRSEWQPAIEKVGTRLGGWHAKLLLRGGRLVLLHSVLTAIPIFYLYVFKLPIGVGKRLESLMRQFMWKGSGPGQRRGQAMVSWDIVCGPIKARDLGTLNIHNMNTTLLTK